VRTKIVYHRKRHLSAPEDKIQEVRRIASEHHTTLNQMFRDWLDSCIGPETHLREHQEFMDRVLNQVRVGSRKFSRDEMNELEILYRY